VSSGVTGASIGKTKVAVLYNTGQLTVYNLDRNNYLSSGNTLVSSGVLGVQMNNDQKIIITYNNNKKTACDLDRNSYLSNCQNF
jgi:competence protein ComGC